MEDTIQWRVIFIGYYSDGMYFNPTYYHFIDFDTSKDNINLKDSSSSA